MAGAKTKREKKEAAEKRRKIWELGFAVLLVVLPEATHVPLVPWGIALWIIAWLLALHLLLTIPFFAQWTVAQRLVIAMYMTILVCVLAQPRMYRKYHREMAEETEGDLYIDNSIAAGANLEAGDSGGIFPWHSANPGPLKLLKDEAVLEAKLGKRGVEVSTVVRDRIGHQVVKVDDNHWQIEKQNSVDHNYTNNALEVLDAGGHVVLQLRLLPDRMQIRGEWHDAYGGGVQVIDCPNPMFPKQYGGCIEVFGSKYLERDKRVTITPMFKYPSSEHWGELSR